MQCSGQFSGIPEQLLRTGNKCSTIATSPRTRLGGAGIVHNVVVQNGQFEQKEIICLHNLHVQTLSLLFASGVSYLTMHAASHYLPPTIPKAKD